ncbi:hypothetical protein ACFB49_07800 [Sphingomonas sp. DBB INV C78]|uniref:nuclear transport factor 2 family protein n=1 Tax=Sphingomonas sp. DBB INV C78 TaxID=3349434 RepID=UPI0036D26F46
MSEWEDRVAINDALARYADGVNRRDVDLWGGSWDEDAQWVLFDPEPVKGRDAIVAAWKQAMEGFPFVVMYVSQGSVAIDGERAEGRSYSSEVAETADGKKMRVYGTYEDEYRKRNGTWGFSSRKFTILRMEEY